MYFSILQGLLRETTVVKFFRAIHRLVARNPQGSAERYKNLKT